jgi:hypothetical protein
MTGEPVGPPKGFARLKDYLPLGLSVVALIVSVSSLYLTQLRNANIEAHATAFLYAFNRGQNWELRLPVTFTNSGARTGVVRNVALEVAGPDRKRQLLQFAYIGGALTTNGDVSNEAVPAAIAVAGRGSEAAQMVFISPRREPDIEIFPRAGRYDVSLLVWNERQRVPTLGLKFGVEVTSHDLDTFAKHPKGCDAVQKQQLDEACYFVELVNDGWRDWKAGPRP